MFQIRNKKTNYQRKRIKKIHKIKKKLEKMKTKINKIKKKLKIKIQKNIKNIQRRNKDKSNWHRFKKNCTLKNFYFFSWNLSLKFY